MKLVAAGNENNIPERKRLAIFASGQGSNLANIHRRIKQSEIANCEIALVLSNNSRSGAMEYAAANGLRSAHVSQLQFGDDAAAYCERLLSICDESEIDLIVLAGYMKMLPAEFVRTYQNRILNVHPALLPAFGGPSMYGMRVHEAVIAAGCKVSGATVHFVSERYDEGPIILQRCCEVRDSDTPQMLQVRVAALEYELLPAAIQLCVDGRLRVQGNRTIQLQ